MVLALLCVLMVLVAACLVILILTAKKLSANQMTSLAPRLEAFEKAQERAERTIREEAGLNRQEFGNATREQRQELIKTLNVFGDAVVKRLTEATNVQKTQFDSFSAQLASFAKASGERLDAARAETAAGSKQLREEIVTMLKALSQTIGQIMNELAGVQKAQLEAFSSQLLSFAKSSAERLDAARSESANGAKQLREEVVTTLKSISENMTKTMGEMSNAQKTEIQTMAKQLQSLSETNEKKLEAVRGTVEGKLQAIQADNAAKLEQVRATVEEKLQGTLEKRLGESFKQVSERLEQVHKGLGEMQALANGVGDLKKVLSNVKTRGTWGEMQLGVLLEQILTPEQYSQNVATKRGSREMVEFAVRLPGREGDGEVVWLPIDAKCPVEDYQRLLEAQESGDSTMAAEAAKQLEVRIKACARDIRDKYINPPITTDFGIMYLPTEGLYAEAIRRPGLLELLQRECRVNLCGPTTLAAMLNSLQMGFRSLAIQKRSSEVWQVLGAVKTQFGKFGDLLDKVHKKLNEANNTIEDASKQTRSIERKLRSVEELPVAEAQKLLVDTEIPEA